jgi:hypothetical protein
VTQEQCIDQTNATEKHTQIQNMGLIYNNAELTIIAAAGESPDYGLPGINSRSRTHQHCFSVDNFELVEVFLFKNMVQNSTWASRAWTLQESVLFRRRLFFTDFEVIFECDSVHQRESIPMKIKEPEAKQYHALLGQSLGVHTDPMIDPAHSYAAANQLTEEFTARHLSFQEDVLNACLGILRHCRVHHLWGVLVQPSPNSTRPYCSIHLDWTMHKPGHRRKNFPSWSWTSIIGRVDMSYMSAYRGSFRECDVHVPLSDGTWQTMEKWSRDNDFIEVSIREPASASWDWFFPWVVEESQRTPSLRHRIQDTISKAMVRHQAKRLHNRCKPRL